MGYHAPSSGTCVENSMVALKNVLKYWLWLMTVAAISSCDRETGSDAPMAAPEPAPITMVVNVTVGTISGTVGEDGLKVYQGIPYAAPPVGDLRWSATAPVVSWEGVRDATKAGPACVQPQGQGGSFYGQSGFEMSEDCLTLNVWTRANEVGEGLAVMVWVHGGALVTGSGDTYPGDLLTSKGVVLVTINYRLGRFGFLSHPDLSVENATGVSGNQGLRDQIAALTWVRDNIASFGGNPGRVTVFGESAGSLSVSLLQASPLAKGLIHGVIGESGAAFQPMWRRDESTSYAISSDAVGEKFFEALAGEGGDKSLAALRKLSTDRVLEVFGSNPDFSNYDSLAIVDGEIIPNEVATIFAEGRQSDVPVLIGSNSDEGTTFLQFFTPIYGEGKQGLEGFTKVTLPETVEETPALYPAADKPEAEESWGNLFADVFFTYPMRTWARSMASVKSLAYLYWFTWHPPIENSEQYRAFHAAEIGYVFGNVEIFGAVPTPADHEFSDRISDIWVQFAKTGSPNGEGLPEWPAYTEANEAYMELGRTIESKTHLRMEQMAMIDKAWKMRRATR